MQFPCLSMAASDRLSALEGGSKGVKNIPAHLLCNVGFRLAEVIG